MSEIIAPIKRHHVLKKTRCGACKGTGVEHTWKLPEAILVPTGNACPSCDGSGAAKPSKSGGA